MTASGLASDEAAELGHERQGLAAHLGEAVLTVMDIGDDCEAKGGGAKRLGHGWAHDAKDEGENGGAGPGRPLPVGSAGGERHAAGTEVEDIGDVPGQGPPGERALHAV